MAVIFGGLFNMANYEYKCEKCNTTTTINKPMSECSREEFCSKCKNKLSRVYSVGMTRYNGSGYYDTDYRNIGSR